MNRYYEECPRGFSNEYTIYVVPSEHASRFEGLVPGARRISRAEAIRLGIRRPAEAKRDGEQWFGGFVDGHASHTGDWRKLQMAKGRIEAAVADTLSDLHERELRKDWEAEITAGG